MHLRLVFTGCLALALALAGCDSGGGDGTTPGTTTTPGAAESAFDDLFGTGGALSSGAADEQGTAACAADDPDCEEPIDPGPVTIALPECPAPLPLSSGATATCTPLCQKIAECRGDTSLVTACVADCADTLRGIESARAGEIFACYTGASCEALAAFRGAEGGASEPPTTPTPAPMPDEGGASDGGADPDDGGADPYYGGGEGGREGGGEPVTVEDPIGECLGALFEGWSTQTLPAAKQAVCEETIAMDADCDGGDVAVSGSGSSSGSGGAEVPGGTPEPDPGADGGAPMPPRDGGDDMPMPPEDDGDATTARMAECTAIAGLLTQPVLTRIRACYDEADCDAREACLDEQLACVPFLRALLFGVIGGEATVSVEVTEPVETNPTDPADTP